MKKCIIIVFDHPSYRDNVEDLDISTRDIKEICDFDDRWEVFYKYLKEDYKETYLYRHNDGGVCDDIMPDRYYGVILTK